MDDATGTAFARFYDRETRAAAFDVFGRYAAAHGLPAAAYVGRSGTYRPEESRGWVADAVGAGDGDVWGSS